MASRQFQYMWMRTALGEDPEEKQLLVGLARRLSPPLSPIRAYGRNLGALSSLRCEKSGWHRHTDRWADSRHLRSERLDDKARSNGREQRQRERR